MTQLLLKPVSHEEAVAFIKDKPALVRETFDTLLPALKARAFTVTSIHDATTLQRIRDRIADIPAGADWDSVKKDVIEQALPFFVDDTADQETQDKQTAAAERRAETILRRETFQAYQAAQYEVMDRQRDVFPFWQYITVGDDSVRPEHEALDQLVLPADSPFWDTHYPPWDWGCRCQVVPLMQDDVDQIAAGDGLLQGRVLSDVEQARLEKTGELHLPNSGQVINVNPRDGAMRWNPGDLRIPLEEIQSRYEAPVWDKFVKDAKSTEIPFPGTQDPRPVWDWLMDGEVADLERQVVAHMDATGREAAMAIDLDSGRRLPLIKGTRDEVPAYGPGAMSAGRWAHIHVHAEGGSFSDADVARFVETAGLVEMRAITPDAEYILRKPEGFEHNGSPAFAAAVADQYAKWYQGDANATMERIARLLGADYVRLEAQ